MECKDTAAGARCYVGQPQGCLETDANCSAASECASGLCNGGACRAKCDVLGDPTASGCALGEGCVRVSPGSSEGMCWPQGTEADGAACTDDKICLSLLCAQDTAAGGGLRCMKPCAPNSATCPQGQGCAPLTDKIGVCQAGANVPDPADAIGGDDAGGFVPATMPYSAPASSSCSAGSGGGGAGGFALLFLAALGLGLSRRRVHKAV
jgi:MYXO-CTERM domain-containing protein